MSDESRRNADLAPDAAPDGAAVPDGAAPGRTQYIRHEEAGEGERGSDASGFSAGDGVAPARAPLGPARVAVAAVASLAIAFCVWSAVMYARGADPIALVSGSAFRTVAEDSAASTSVAPAVGGEKGASGTGGAATGGAAAAGAALSDGAVSDQGSAAGDPGARQDGGRGDAQGSQGSQGAQGAADASSGSAQPPAQTPAGADPTASPEPGPGDARPAGDEAPSSAEAAPAPSSEISVSVTIDGSLVGAGGGTATVVLERGATAYDALLACGVDVYARPTGFGMYVAGINGVAETPTTGWTYTVGGSMPGVACSAYTLDDGDSVVWTYVRVDENM